MSPTRQQPPSYQVQVGQGEKRKYPCRVLGQAPVAHLGKAPQSLDDMEGVLAASTTAGTRLVNRSLIFGQWFAPIAPAINAVTNARLPTMLPMVFAPIGLIAI